MSIIGQRREQETGKSTLLRGAFPEARYVDLLEADTFRVLSAYPEALRQTLTDELLGEATR